MNATLNNNVSRNHGRTQTVAIIIAAVVLTSSSLGQTVGGAGGARMQKMQRIQRIVEHMAFDRDAAQAGSPGVCVELATLSIMFESAASDEEISAKLEELSSDEFEEFVAQGSRWTFTATDGNVDEGMPMTITYSFVPDGTEISGSVGEPDSPSNLFSTFDNNFPGGRAAWKAAFAESFARWGELTNINYVEVADDGSSFTTNALGSLGSRGDVRISMHPIGAGPLAYNFYPSVGGDMVLDSDDIGTFTNSTGNFRGLRNVLMHEHGHGLGIKHSIPQDGTKLMEPGLNTAFDGPQEDDIRAAQFIYGDSFEDNNTLRTNVFSDAQLRHTSDVGEQAFVLENLALEREASADFYGLTVSGSFEGFARLAVRLEPVGTEYQAGPQYGTPELVDALAARNLNMRVWRRISSVDNTFQLHTTINFSEAGEDEYHPPLTFGIGGYFVVEVYSDDGIDDVQRYRLTISNAAIEETQGPAAIPALLVANGLEVVNESDFVRFDETEIGQTGGIALTISNQGDGPLEFTGPATVAGLNASDFVVGGLPVSLEPGALGGLGISFVPTAPGSRVALVTIPSNDPDFPEFSFIVQGNAVEAVEAVLLVSDDAGDVPKNSTLDMGELEVGTTYELELTLENTGNANLTVQANSSFNGTDADDFAIETALPISIPAGTSESLIVTVTPSAEGARAAQLRLLSNSVQGQYRINFTADAIAAFDDCNNNGVADDQEIADDPSIDCDGNGQPDECQTDSDGDGVIDACDDCPDIDNSLDSDDDGLNDCEDAYPNDPTNGQGNGQDPNEVVNNDPNVVVYDDPNIVGYDDPNEPNYGHPELPLPGGCGFGAGPMLMFSLLTLCGHKGAVRRKRAC